MQVGGKRSLYRTHRAIDDDRLAAAFVLAMGRLPGRFERVLAAIGAAMDEAVEHPDVIVAELLAGIPRALVEETQRAALAEAPISRFGLLNVITRVRAHDEYGPRGSVRDGSNGGDATDNLSYRPGFREEAGSSRWS